MMKIIELKINDIIDESGVDGIALVNKPAIEEDWYWFNEQKQYIPKDKELDKLIGLMNEYGQPISELEEEGWIIVKVEGVDVKKEKDEFSRRVFTDIVSNPNEESALDGPDANTGMIVRVRYKYAGPQDSKNRTFCGSLISANRVYRREDIDQMTIQMANPNFGSYNIFEYRGSYNCRHKWIKITYKSEGKILNKSNSRRGVISTEDIEQLSTETMVTANDKQIKESQFGKIKFSLDDEKRTIVGPAMIPDKMIPRRNPIGDVYSVFFTEETIRKISEKFLREKHTDKTNLEHTPINLNDVYVTESWIIEDSENDKSTKFGYSLPKGTWMISMKILDDKIWKSVKEGHINGFSVEGFFIEKLIFNKEDLQVQEIINIINKTTDE